MVLLTNFKLLYNVLLDLSALWLKLGSFESTFRAGIYVTLLPAACTSPDLCSTLGAGKLHIAFFHKTDSA
jgi:hypothetical protein